MANDLSININAKNNTGSAFGGVVNGLKGIESASGNASKSMKSVGEAFGSMGEAGQSAFGRIAEFAGGSMLASGIEKIGSGIVSVTEKLVAFGASSIEASNKFNAGLANVASLGVPIDHINEYKEAIQSMAVEVGKETSDLTGGLYQVESAFGDTSDTMKILEINAKAGAAGLATTTDAINLTSAATKGYNQVGAEYVQHVADLALKTVELGQTTFPELAGGIGQVTMMSNKLNIAQEEIFAGAAALTGVLPSTSQVFTAQRGAMQALLSPTEDMTTLFKKLGVANGEAMIKQYGWGKTMEIVNAAAERAHIPLQKLVSSVEGQQYVMGIAGAQNKKYKDSLLEMNRVEGETNKAFLAQTNGINKLGFKLQQAGIWWGTFKEKAGDAIGNVALALLPALEPAINGMAAKLEGFLPIVEAWGNDVSAKMSAAFGKAGGGVTGAMAAAGAVTGGTFSVEADVKKVDWGTWTYTYDANSDVTAVDWKGALGDKTTYTYDAGAKILEIDWVSKLDKESTFTYDAKAGIASIDWNYDTGGALGFTYDAKAGITDINWRAKDFTYLYNAKAGVTEVYFGKGLFVGNYTATASVTSVAWGLYTNEYSATTKIAESSVLWGTYTHTYNAKADVDQASIFWGAATHSYQVSGVVGEASILWGAYTHSYQVSGQIGQTGVLWGAWTHTYNALVGIDSTAIAWGAWTHSYSASAQVSENSILWGAFTYTYDAKANVTSWTIFGKSSSEWVASLSGALDFTSAKLPEWKWPDYNAWTWSDYKTWTWPDIPTPSWLSSLLNWSPKVSISGATSAVGNALSGAYNYMTGGGDPSKNADGTGGFGGGWSWVGERGPELMKLPRGTQIMSNFESSKYIANNAAGTTTAPPASNGFSASENAAINKFAAAMEQGGDKAGKKIQKAMEKAAEQQQQRLESALGKVPGLFGTSEVTQKQLDMAKLGIPQNFADDYIRQLTDTVMNGKGWDGVDIKDAAMRAGIDPGLPAKVILDMVKEQWNDQSFFAGGKNTELINLDAVKAEIAKQQAQASGHASIMALFGIKSEDVTAQGGQLVDLLNQGIAGGMAGSGKGKDGKAQGNGIGTAIVAGAVADIKDSKVDAGGQLASALSAQLSGSTAFAGTGSTILQAIVDSWADATKSVDMLGGIADALKIQVDSKDSVELLKNVGGRIAQILKAGIDDYFESSSVADSVNKSVSKATGTGGAGTGTPVADHKAIGTSSYAGGLSWVGESGPELLWIPPRAGVYPQRQMDQQRSGDTHIWNVTIQNDIDVQSLAYRVSQIQQRKRN